MVITGLTLKQVEFADILWNCQSTEEMLVLVETLGKDAEVVRDMIIANTLDDFSETDIAQHILSTYCL